MLNPNLSVKNAYYIGDRYSKNLEKLGIYTIEDLLYHYPIKYTDSRNITEISNLSENDTHVINGIILSINTIYTKNRMIFTKAIIEDNTGKAEIIWFNQKYLEQTIKNQSNIIIVGKCKLQKNGIYLFSSPQFEIIKNNTETVHFLKITPIYNQTKGISSKWLRSRIKNLLLNTIIEDPLPQEIKEKYDLLDKKEALEKLHFPANFEDIKKAKKRLGFDEILYIQILSYLKREERKKRDFYKIVIDQNKVDQFIKDLPFILTQSQIKCINEIYEDIKKDIPMNRLIEGDVGSGKTIIAIIIAYTMALENIQSAVMVPTLILSKQHYLNFSEYLNKYNIEIQQITNNTKSINPSAHIFIGTHALLFKKGFLENVGLVIIDEQHRFGVTQRELLIQHGKSPHILTMSATPIPRTLALGIYGDLDISIINEKPKERIPIKTYIVPQEKREDAYNFIKERLNKKEKTFILCPLIEESDKIDIKNVENEYKLLKEDIFKEYNVGLIHGKMKNKDTIMEDFRNNKYDILVTTQVIEVGIDIQSATIMVIENAERFGLAQLHQIRGRVGRSQKQSYCFLFTNDINNERLRFFTKNNDGMKLAEFDLKSRGPGEVYGSNQSGAPDLKMASLLDSQLIKLTRTASIDIIKNLEHYPILQHEIKIRQDKILNMN